MSTFTAWVVAVFTVFIVIAFVLASATLGIPSETSVPLLILLAFISLRSFKKTNAFTESEWTMPLC